MVVAGIAVLRRKLEKKQAHPNPSSRRYVEKSVALMGIARRVYDPFHSCTAQLWGAQLTRSLWKWGMFLVVAVT